MTYLASHVGVEALEREGGSQRRSHNLGLDSFVDDIHPDWADGSERCTAEHRFDIEFD